MKLALIGDPVAHSASPALHRAFLEEAGVAGSYEAIRVAAGDGARAIADLRAAGYRGLNVTTPLKEEALVACERIVDPLAILADSVNVILFQNDATYGFNTDGFGAFHSICDALGIEVEVLESSEVLEGVRIAVLGVGPTARAALGFLALHGAKLTIWNRTRERAEAAAERFGVSLWDGSEIDVILSTLPPDAQLDEQILTALRTTPTVIDANYGPRATLANLLAREVIDGISMLRHSARASFRLFSIPRSERLGETEANVSVWLSP